MESVTFDKVTYIHGDCMDYMRSLPDRSIDLILTDPPYEMDIHGGTRNNDFGTRKLIRDKHIDKICQGFDYDAVFNEFMRLCKVPNMLIFCSNNQVSKTMSWFEQRGILATLLVWQKYNPIPLCFNKYLSDVEFIIYVHDKGSTFNNDCPFDYKHKVYTSGIVSNKDRIHPTQKSVEHLMRFIYLHTNKGDTILDPFGGSMTTGIAAYNTGRKFVGIEIDDAYYNAAVNRIKKNTKQLKIF